MNVLERRDRQLAEFDSLSRYKIYFIPHCFRVFVKKKKKRKTAVSQNVQRSSSTSPTLTLV